MVTGGRHRSSTERGTSSARLSTVRSRMCPRVARSSVEARSTVSESRWSALATAKLSKTAVHLASLTMPSASFRERTLKIWTVALR